MIGPLGLIAADRFDRDGTVTAVSRELLDSVANLDLVAPFRDQVALDDPPFLLGWLGDGGRGRRRRWLFQLANTFFQISNVGRQRLDLLDTGLQAARRR
ncbi:MAG: hypothetical protein QOF22_318, partial [Bradyrhizobium sp.]|nr:hypothetical protein [Bradyrhizobium sp.]